MLIRMLDALGLFIGVDKDDNYQAWFFQHLNTWFLRQSGGSSEHPKPIHDLLENKEARTLVVDYTRYLLKTPRVLPFLGWRKYLCYRTLFGLDIPWGWKDPSTTFTLPLWLDIFPDAKIIHIYRHGVDVANSTRAKAQRRQPQTWKHKLYYKVKPYHWLRPKRGNFVRGLRSASLEGAFSLWEEYVSEARTHIRNSHNQTMELKYEDLLAEQRGFLESLASFCELPVDDRAISRMQGWVNKDRAYAYRANPQLKVFSDQVAERLSAQGY